MSIHSNDAPKQSTAMPDMDATLNELSTAFNRHDWQQTRRLATQLLPRLPNHPLLRYIAGIAELELQNMPMALTHLHVATNLAPDRVDFAVQFAKALSLAKMTREAHQAANHAMAMPGMDAAMLDSLGVIYTQAHAHAEAAQAFRRAVTMTPNHAPYRFNLATALLAIGSLNEAETELETCIRLDSHHWQAHLSLAQARRQTRDNNHIQRMQSLLESQATNHVAQTCLNMALAKEYEDCANYPAAFLHYTKGKHAAGKGRGYSIEHDEALFAAITAAFPWELPTVSGCPSHEPIFVIGMPRTGTTLVDRIISSHPDVHPAGELMNFAVALKRASGSCTPLLLDADTISRTRNVNLTEVGTEYIASTRPATGNTPRFIDKLPHNFLFAGWIARALPHAKIICLRRDPLDTCLSNLRQLFAPQSPYYAYSFDLNDIGRYYALFDRLIAHWQHVFPGRILEVHYEDLVQEQEAHSRRLLDFCQLSWHEDCLHFERNPAPVNTASVVQVRNPIYRNALQRWRKYEPQLGKLRTVLREHGIPLPD